MAMDFLSMGFDQMVTSVTSKITETYDSATKPIIDYFSENSQQIDREQRRQNFIKNKKEQYKKNDDIRRQYGIATKNNMIKLLNDSDYTCHIVFVNDDHAKNKEEAIAWANKVLESGLLNSDFIGINNTKVVTLKTNTDTDLINEEFSAYFIVLHLDQVDIGNKFIILDKEDFVKGDIRVKNKYNIKDTSFTDFLCKWKIFG